MNRFSANPFSRYPQQSNFRSQFQFNPNLKPSVPSQIQDPRFNDDTISVTSETTCFQGVSQENFSGFKSELCEMFKTLIEGTQKNLANLIESVKSANEIGIVGIKEKVIHIHEENKESFKEVKIPEIVEIKDQILMMQNEN